MYFFETSGRSWLTPREACSLESASLKSNLQVNIIFTSSFLDLHDNSTCYLFQTVPNIHFYTIKLKDAFEGTPLERIYQRAEFRKSSYGPTHLSDMLRVAIIYKYGGFYSDLDSITIKAWFRNGYSAPYLVLVYFWIHTWFSYLTAINKKFNTNSNHF